MIFHERRYTNVPEYTPAFDEDFKRPNVKSLTAQMVIFLTEQSQTAYHIRVSVGVPGF